MAPSHSCATTGQPMPPRSSPRLHFERRRAGRPRRAEPRAAPRLWPPNAPPPPFLHGQRPGRKSGGGAAEGTSEVGADRSMRERDPLGLGLLAAGFLVRREGGAPGEEERRSARFDAVGDGGRHASVGG
eukprot:scaffold334_cov241-Pinguiococcus_pyrenoidosus.AAC.38